MRSTLTDGECTLQNPHATVHMLAHACMAQVLRERKIHHHHPTMQSSLLFSSSTSSTLISLAPWHSSCPTSSTPSLGLPCTIRCWTIPRQDDHGPMAADAPVTILHKRPDDGLSVLEMVWINWEGVTSSLTRDVNWRVRSVSSWKDMALDSISRHVMLRGRKDLSNVMVEFGRRLP